MGISQKINYLTQAQYDSALANSGINENELYSTPAVEYASPHYCLARVSANKTNTAGVTSSPTLAITSQNGDTWTRADSNTSLVCPTAGTYEVSGTIAWNPSSSGTWLVTFVMGIGGTDYTAYATSTGGTRVSATISPTIVTLSSGDKIDIRVTTTGAGTIQSGNPLSRIAIRRIK